MNTQSNTKTYLQSGLFRAVQLAVVLTAGFMALEAYEYVSGVFDSVEQVMEKAQ